MANDGTVTFSVWLDADDAEKELTNIKKKIIDLETELSAQKGVKSNLEENLQKIILAADEAKERLYQMEKTGASAVELKEQRSVVEGYEKSLNAAYAAIEKQNAKIADTNALLDAQKGKFGAVQQQALATGATEERAASGASSATDQLSARLDKLTNRIAGLAKRVLVFSLFTRAFRALRDYVGAALQTNEEFTASVARLKGALLTAFQPIYTAIVPWVTAFINVLAQAMNMIARFTSMLGGTSVDASAAAAESLYDESKALNAVGGSAGKAAKQLAGFDEINKLDGSAGGGGGGGGGGIAADFSGMDGLTDAMREREIEIEGLSLLLGAILAFSGVNVPLGIGLMALGALGLADDWPENWDYIKQKLQGSFGAIVAIGGALLLSLGLVLAFTGANVPLGIGLALAGAGLLGLSAAANWDFIKQKLQGSFGKIVAIGAALLLALGLVLAFTGAALPLGIAMALAGAGILAIDAKANGVNWDTIYSALQGEFGKIAAIGAALLLALGLVLIFTGAAAMLGIAMVLAGAGILALDASANGINWDFILTQLQGEFGKIALIGGSLLLALGLVLAFTGAALPLGIAMALAGAGILAIDAKANGVNWNYIRTLLQGEFGKIALIGGSLLLALGLVLAFTGVALPLGIAMALAGAGILGVTAKANGINWDLIKEKLTGAWERISNWFNQNVAPVFTVQWWTDKLSVIGDGMKAAINAAIAAVETGINWIVSKLNTIAFDVPDWVPSIGGQRFGLNIPEVKIPRLAAGAVIPPNREFLAVLGDQPSGTNIETPLETMVAAFRQALSEGAGSRTLVLKVGEYEFAQLVFNAFTTEDARVGFSSVT